MRCDQGSKSDVQGSETQTALSLLAILYFPPLRAKEDKPLIEVTARGT